MEEFIGGCFTYIHAYTEREGGREKGLGSINWTILAVFFIAPKNDAVNCAIAITVYVLVGTFLASMLVVSGHWYGPTYQ